MDHYLIFIEYDSYEYVNFYNLNDNDGLLKQFPAENVDGLVQTLAERACPFALSIVKAHDVMDWDELHRKLDAQFRLLENHSTDQAKILTSLEVLYPGRTYVMEELGNANSAGDVSIVFSGTCSPLTDAVADPESVEDTLEKAKAILTNGGQGMTELARIIREKYERMNHNG